MKNPNLRTSLLFALPIVILFYLGDLLYFIASGGEAVVFNAEGSSYLFAFALVLLVGKIAVAGLAARAMREDKPFFRTVLAMMQERDQIILTFISFGVTLVPLLNLIPYFYAGKKLAREFASIKSDEH